MEDNTAKNTDIEIKSNVQKKCFVIMPISDHPDYENNHFTRVYEYMIKPACEKAGYKAVRADDDLKTDHITISILKQIVESDMAICDMSSRNPNVFYELGMRQAFNMRTVLIRDNSTTIPFDIQDLRALEYDKNLRIDNIQTSIEEIATTIKETEMMEPNEVNSLISLIGIQTAKVSKDIEMSPEVSVLLKELRVISSNINDLRLENQKKKPTDISDRSSSSYMAVQRYKRRLYLGEDTKRAYGLDEDKKN